jgi:hypothetical protein
MPDFVQGNLIAPLTTINAKFGEYYKAYNEFKQCIETEGVNGPMTSTSTPNVYQGVRANAATTPIFTYNANTKQYGSTGNCSTQATSLNAAYETLNSDLSTFGADAATATTAAPDTFPEFQKHYQEMQGQRSNLDMKLAQLYKIENSLPSLSDRSVDSVILASILWIVLAGALTYYIFIGNLFNMRWLKPDAEST